jgi:hypothetical protein
MVQLPLLPEASGTEPDQQDSEETAGADALLTSGLPGRAANSMFFFSN